MKLKDYKYERPSIDNYVKSVKSEIARISDENTKEEQHKAILNIFELDKEISTMSTLCSIRNSINTKDEFYEKEQAFFDENYPHIQAVQTEMIDKILISKHRKYLEEKLGSLMFEKAEVTKKTFKPEVIAELQEENKLGTEYGKLLAGAEIPFNGKIYNLSQMSPFAQSTDRETRKNAQLAVSGFFKNNEEAIDNIYDKLVKVRDSIARKLGYKNFVQLGYDRFERTDYTSEDVKSYRDQILEEVVPVVVELTNKKAKRIGIKNPKSYDLALSFLSGNPTPKGDSKWLLEKARKMYNEMSKETGEFIEFMIKHDLLELDSKPGKMGGGYCTYIEKYESPFIFANFNGTSHDVDVLTHEAGHAFQVYSSRNLISPYLWPTMEAAEIHSMSMEFFAWPWINEMMLEDTEKYKYNHLAGAVSFLPYGVLVDEFQHYVYENPNVSPNDRKTKWRELERKYLPFKDYGEDDFLEKGTFWYRQGHIFNSPFYYIDYTLAQVCAFQYWINDQSDHEKAFNNYLGLCKLGGSKSFTELLKTVGLKNPFSKGTVKEIVTPIKAYLDSIDDTKF